MRTIAYKGEGDFCAYELCDGAYNSFEKQNIWKAKEMKEQNNKKTKMLLKINKEFLLAQHQILTLG